MPPTASTRPGDGDRSARPSSHQGLPVAMQRRDSINGAGGNKRCSVASRSMGRTLGVSGLCSNSAYVRNQRRCCGAFETITIERASGNFPCLGELSEPPSRCIRAEKTACATVARRCGARSVLLRWRRKGGRIDAASEGQSWARSWRVQHRTRGQTPRAAHDGEGRSGPAGTQRDGGSTFTPFGPT